MAAGAAAEGQEERGPIDMDAELAAAAAADDHSEPSAMAT